MKQRECVIYARKRMLGLYMRSSEVKARRGGLLLMIRCVLLKWSFGGRTRFQKFRTREASRIGMDMNEGSEVTPVMMKMIDA